jgi:hypothetical protein
VSCPANKSAVSVVDFTDWQGATTSNSTAIARSRNAARHEKSLRDCGFIGGTGHQQLVEKIPFSTSCKHTQYLMPHA